MRHEPAAPNASNALCISYVKCAMSQLRQMLQMRYASHRLRPMRQIVKCAMSQLRLLRQMLQMRYAANAPAARSARSFAPRTQTSLLTLSPPRRLRGWSRAGGKWDRAVGVAKIAVGVGATSQLRARSATAAIRTPHASPRPSERVRLTYRREVCSVKLGDSKRDGCLGPHSANQLHVATYHKAKLYNCGISCATYPKPAIIQIGIVKS